ncbi:MAG: response regulator transcription factor [Verrucomicrobia bacterium]|nr:response regulator transcription factor [Verrucomicrobiota bacterium]
MNPPAICQVLIVDDHPSIAQLLAEFIDQQPGFKVVGTVNEGPAAIQACAEHRPDLIVLDIGLPDKSGGLAVLATVRKLHPDTHVLVFSASSTMHVVQEAMRLGAHGFLEKTAPLSELLDALQRVRQGSTYLGARVSAMLREVVKNGLSQSVIAAQEQTILRLLARGAVVKEIATSLNLSPSMIYKLLTRLREHLGAKTNEDLIVIAVQRGWLEVEDSRSGSPASP